MSTKFHTEKFFGHGDGRVVEYQQSVESAISSSMYGDFRSPTYALPNARGNDAIITAMEERDREYYAWKNGAAGIQYAALSNEIADLGVMTDAQQAQLVALAPLPNQRALSSEENELYKRMCNSRDQAERTMNRCAKATAEMWTFFESTCTGEFSNYMKEIARAIEARHIKVNKLIKRIQSSEYMEVHRDYVIRSKAALKLFMPNAEGVVSQSIADVTALQEFLTVEETVFTRIQEHAEATERMKHTDGALAGQPVVKAVPVADTDADRIPMLFNSMQHNITLLDPYNMVRKAHQQGGITYTELKMELRKWCTQNKPSTLAKNLLGGSSGTTAAVMQTSTSASGGGRYDQHSDQGRDGGDGFHGGGRYDQHPDQGRDFGDGYQGGGQFAASSSQYQSQPFRRDAGFYGGDRRREGGGWCNFGDACRNKATTCRYSHPSDQQQHSQPAATSSSSSGSGSGLVRARSPSVESADRADSKRPSTPMGQRGSGSGKYGGAKN